MFTMCDILGTIKITRKYIDQVIVTSNIEHKYIIDITKNLVHLPLLGGNLQMDFLQ